MYQLAADQGNACAQNNLGCLHYFGNEVEKDYNRAAQLYQTAADQGNANALDNFGYFYQKGYAVGQDSKRAGCISLQ